VYFLLEHLLFAHLTGTAPNLNSVASYLPLLSFVTFCETGLSIRKLIKIFAIVSAVYLLIYVAGHSFLVGLNASGGSGLLSADSSRANRLYLLAPWASFVAFYALKSISRQAILSIVIIALAFAALWLSGSRTYQLFFAAVFACATFHLTGRWLRGGLFVFFLVIMFLQLYGLFSESWNPYAYMAWDDSAYYRSLEYARIINGLRDNWLLGTGVPSDLEILADYLKASRHEQIFASDLGPIGIMFMFGLPGLAALIYVVYFCTAGSDRVFSFPELRAVQLNCLLCAGLAVLSPMIVLESASVFLGLLAAIHVRARRDEGLRKARAARAANWGSALSSAGGRYW
jgi:hypothetical protein